MNHYKHDTEAQQWIHEDTDHVAEQFLTIEGQLKHVAAFLFCAAVISSIIWLWVTE